MTRQPDVLLAVLAFAFLLLVGCQGERAQSAATAVPPTLETAVDPPDESEFSDVSVEADMAALGALVEHPWQWVSFTSPVEPVEIEDPTSYVIDFINDGTINIKADCNRAAGSYTVAGASLTVALGPATLAACPPESRSDQFLQLLGNAAVYFFEDGKLHIDLLADGGTLVFAPAAADAMNGEGS